MTITRAHLVDSIHARVNLSKRESARLLEALLELMKETLQSGEDLLISGFGKFCVRDNRDRRGRNPRTGEDLMLERRRVVTFECSPVLRDKVNGKR